jgi:8-oxo-dGTP diphosphatase
MLDKLERRLQQGLKLLQVREPALPDRHLFTQQVIGRAHRYGCKVMVKAPFAGADGMHFTAAQLMSLGERPTGMLAAASCHTRSELEHAMRLGLDFAVAGPVKEKRGSAPLGWAGFRRIAEGASIPVYAIGGLRHADLQDAWRSGAHGVAMIRGAWG